MRSGKFLCVLLVMAATFSQAQRSKVQAAWRALTEYEETLKEGRPDASYLGKASQAIDQALANEDSRNQIKTHAYKLRISYLRFQLSLSEEMKRLEPTVQDKNERALQAYGNIPLDDMESAIGALNRIRDIDAGYLDRIQAGLQKGSGSLDDEELKFAMAAQQMKMEAANIASGKYKAKKYGEAADYFYRSAVVNSLLYSTKDTASFYNACVAAARSRQPEKILEYNNRMIEANIASPYNYESLYNAHVTAGDSVRATEILGRGRAAFPSDIGLLTQETNLFLATGRQKEALANLEISVQKDPSNPLYYFIIGNIYDNLANPKDKSGKEQEKPAGFGEYFSKAEANYLKAIELKPANREYLYNSYYNLGAMYNNYGGYIASAKTEKTKDAVRMQRENEARAQEFYKKAIPHLEQALSIKPDDRTTMTALRKLYLLTGNDARAKEMSEKLKAPN